MKAPHKLRPHLEILEDRVVPVTNLTFDGFGNLTAVSSNELSVELKLVGNNTIDVITTSGDQGTFSTTTSLTVTEANSLGSPQIAFDSDNLGPWEFDGNIIINAGNAVGGNNISFTSAANPNSFTIAGNVTVTSGNGPDTFSYGQNADVTQFGSLRVDLGTVAGNILAPNDTMTLGFNGGSSITGNVTLFNGTNVSVTSLPIGGSLSLNAARQQLNQIVGITATTVDQNLSIVTGNFTDAVTIGADVTVNGSAVINLGNGQLNSLGGAPGDSLISAGSVLGTLAVQTGNGPETVSLSGTVGGGLAVTLGTGATNTTLSALTVLGTTIRYSAGNGANILNVNTLTAPGARFTAVFGAGNDTFNIDNTAIILASAFFDGGYGVNHIHNTGFYFYPVTLRNFR